jgi:hypothetical protein
MISNLFSRVIEVRYYQITFALFAKIPP